MTANTRTVITLWLLCASCQHTAQMRESSSEGAESTGPTGRQLDISGWEGFFPWRDIDGEMIEGRGIPLDSENIRQLFDRIGKLVIASDEAEVSEEELTERFSRYCETPEARRWNESLCRSIEARQCSEGSCRYQHFGNCSGVFIGHGVFLTAAHCVASLSSDEALRSQSVIIRATGGGEPGERLDLGEILLGKHDFSHHFVALNEEDPVDVAAIHVDDGDLERLPTSGLPVEGSPLFIVGFPRVERRSEEDRRRAGYELNFGTPAVSFGRVADCNGRDLPLCNVDGYQEHWRLTSPCPSGVVEIEGEQTWRGVITGSPFLATYDSSNGYSGGPVFDEEGRLVGINVTLISATDPQERFSEESRMVAISIARVLSRLHLEP